MQPYINTLAPKAASIEELIQKAKTFFASSKAPAKLKAYRNDWCDFESWCREHQLPMLPSTPQTVALYIADRASILAAGTITRRLTSKTRRIRLRDSQTLPQQHVTSLSARHSKESDARWAPHKKEKIRFCLRTFARSLLSGARAFWDCGTPHSCWWDSQGDSAGRSLN
jgi:hypothetical protein